MGILNFGEGKIVIPENERLIPTAPLGNESLIRHSQFVVGLTIPMPIPTLFCKVNIVNNSDSGFWFPNSRSKHNIRIQKLRWDILINPRNGFYVQPLKIKTLIIISNIYGPDKNSILILNLQINASLIPI